MSERPRAYQWLPKAKHPSPKAPRKCYGKHRHTSTGHWEFLVHPLKHFAHPKHDKGCWCSPKSVGKRKMEGEKLRRCRVSCTWAHAWAGALVLLCPHITPQGQVYGKWASQSLRWTSASIDKCFSAHSCFSGPHGSQRGMPQGNTQNATLGSVSHSHFCQPREGYF